MGNFFEKVLRGEQPYDVYAVYNQETKIIEMFDMEVPLNPKGLGYDLFHIIPNHFGKIVQRDAFTDEADTYDDLYKRSIRTAIKLQKLGLEVGDRVTLCSYNNINCASVYLGTLFAGGIPANVDPLMSQEDIELLVAQVNSKFIFVSDDSIEKVEKTVANLQLETNIVVFGGSDKYLGYEEFVCEQEGEDRFQPYEIKSLDDLALILFSSGSTGLPKGICLSHRFIQYHTNIGKVSHYMLFPTLYWISGNLSLIMTLKGGGIRSITRVFDPELIWSHILKYNVEMMQVTPFEAMELIKAKPDVEKIPLQNMSIGAYATSEENKIALRKGLPGVAVGDFFAMTETGLLFTGIDPISYVKMKSVGIPVPNFHFKIVDPETEEILGFNQPGELRVKSKYIFSGYYNKDSSDNFDDDGFFKTGDVAYYDEDFSFFIVDRIKEMFKYKGAHITPVKLEKILYEHPDVFRALIVGVPHPTDEHHICAVVVPVKGSKITPEEIEEFFNARVDDRQKIRAGVKFFDSVPVTPTGKISRMAVKKRVIAEMKQ